MYFSRLLSISLFLLCLSATAQPPARIREAQNSEANRTGAGATRNSGSRNNGGSKTNDGISYREFPTAQTMPSDAVWRREVYRMVDLTKDENAPLYFPVTPSKDRENLFVYLFHLILRGQIKAYEYTRDANEHFDASNVVKAKKIMDDQGIFYESKDGKMKVNDVDLPSEEVKLYFLKENVYYDQNTASFRTQVSALCPVIVRGTNSFGEDETMRVPLFWVNYEEAAPYLAKLKLMGSNFNNAAEISGDDFFNTTRYRGEIYKVTNLQDRIIAQYATTDSARSKESSRIEKEIRLFEEKLWGENIAKTQKTSVKDSLNNDSSAAEDGEEENGTRTSRRGATNKSKTKSAENTKATKTTKVKTSTPRSSSTVGLSVRRQRR